LRRLRRNEKRSHSGPRGGAQALQPVYSCLRRAERAAHEEDASEADGIRSVMDQLDSAKGQLEELLRPGSL
jgi:hypothetical protein